MANKYESHLRTFTARNLVWNSAASVPGLFTLGPPNVLTLADADFVTQFYRANQPVHEWRAGCNMNVKRAGVFSNFADGLVLSNTKQRLALLIRSALWYRMPCGGTVDFTVGSRDITGTNLNSIFPTGSGFIADNDNILTANFYSVSNVTATTGLLSDYALRTAGIATNTYVNRVDYLIPGLSTVTGYQALLLPVLNSMVEFEGFYFSIIAVPPTYDNSVARPVNPAVGVSYIAGASDGVWIINHTYQWTGTVWTDITKVQLFNCNLCLIPTSTALGDTFDLQTVTIDTGFLGVEVSFDSMIEIEFTPG